MHLYNSCNKKHIWFTLRCTYSRQRLIKSKNRGSLVFSIVERSLELGLRFFPLLFVTFRGFPFESAWATEEIPVWTYDIVQSESTASVAVPRSSHTVSTENTYQKITFFWMKSEQSRLEANPSPTNRNIQINTR